MHIRTNTERDMEETLVYALLRTTRKLHYAIQMKDSQHYAPAEQEHGEHVLGEWLDGQPDPPSELAEEVLGFLMHCEAARVS